MAKLEHTKAGDFLPFYSAGTQAKGQYRCTDCGYGITIHEELPTCPMCGGTSWEVEWARDGALESASLL